MVAKGVGDVENPSRGLRTHDTILAWEPAWMDPICEGFREAVRGSDLLVRLHADGLWARGVVYTDIVSTVDLLVHPPLEQSPPGTEVRVVRPFAGGRPVWHGELGRTRTHAVWSWRLWVRRRLTTMTTRHGAAGR
ncbi:hypothetical protein DQ226_05565 [Dietzia maris]|uniref:Uncharacterized protein n=1 Tax=Dietzia maris TaxID=37915 RepID=A0A365PCH1_9ACTN|nr:hypothetical protein DQ226_05565 [Dietzia maris]